jgi:hypothetical protein
MQQPRFFSVLVYESAIEPTSAWVKSPRKKLVLMEWVSYKMTASIVRSLKRMEIRPS